MPKSPKKKHTPLPADAYSTAQISIPLKFCADQYSTESRTEERTKLMKHTECAVCLELKPAFWSCVDVCVSGHVCKSCYTHPLYDPRRCPVCRRSDTNIILKEKYDIKWFLLFIYTITAVIYVILFAFVCCMLNTTNVLLFASVCYIFHTVGVLGMCTFFFVHFSPIFVLLYNFM